MLRRQFQFAENYAFFLSKGIMLVLGMRNANYLLHSASWKLLVPETKLLVIDWKIILSDWE